MKIRLNRLQIKFDLLRPLEDPTAIIFRDHPSKIVSLEHWQKNIIQFEDFTAILSTRSLIITGVQRYLKASEDVESQEADIMSAIIPFAEQVEAKIQRIYPRFKLKRLDRGVLAGKIISRELAYEHHPIAESIKHMEIRDPEDNKPRIVVDQSKGFPELETVHKLHATQDMEMLRRNTFTMSQVDLSEEIDTLRQEYYRQSRDSRKEFDYQVASIMDVLQNMATRMKEIVERIR